jgi:hypothetical protein
MAKGNKGAGGEPAKDDVRAVLDEDDIDFHDLFEAFKTAKGLPFQAEAVVTAITHLRWEVRLLRAGVPVRRKSATSEVSP